MKMEYIDDVSLILIYGEDTAAVDRLVAAFCRMANGMSTGCEVHEVLGETPGMIRLSASVAKRNVGVMQTSPTTFEWKLKTGAWDNITGLLEPFSFRPEEEKGHRHQYLNQSGCSSIEVIVSTDRSW